MKKYYKQNDEFFLNKNNECFFANKTKQKTHLLDFQVILYMVYVLFYSCSIRLVLSETFSYLNSHKRVQNFSKNAL